MTFLNNVKDIDVFYDEPMCKHTSFRVGGSAKALVIPKSIEALKEVIALCERKSQNLFFIGNGSNVLVPDEGLDGIVIKLFGGLNDIKVSDNRIEAEAGVLLSSLSKEAYKNGLTGLEFAEGIPGTVGGAAIMNAGAYDGEIKNVISKVECISDGKVIELDKEKMKLGYRSSIMQSNGMIVVKAYFCLEKGNKDEILSKMKDFKQRRRSKQPLEFPSAGSTFKRPSGYFAGKLIEDAGLRGYKLGGAMVSEKHCGFIINHDNATCTEILRLIEYVQKTVYEKFGVNLETEVKLLK